MQKNMNTQLNNNTIPVKIKMTLEQYESLTAEYTLFVTNTKNEFITFRQWLDKKFSKLIDKKINEVIKNAK